MVIGYLYLRKSPEPKKNNEIKQIDPLSGYTGPEIILGNMYSEYLPGKTESYGIEGYNIEYLTGENVDYVELSRQVNITFMWANKAGFDNVNKLVFKRYIIKTVPDNNNGTTTEATNTNDDIIINKSEDTKQYFYNFYPEKDDSGNQNYHKITFKGVSLPDDNTISLVGKNAIVMYYSETGEDGGEILTPLTPEETSTDVQSVEIFEDKITQALDSYKSIIDTFPPKIRQGNDIKVKSDIEKIGYFISTGNNENVIQEYIDNKYGQSEIYMIPQTGNTSMKLKFEHESVEQFIKFERDNNRGGSFSIVNSIDKATPFTIVKEEVDEDALSIKYKFKFNDGNTDYYMTLTEDGDTVDTYKLVMLSEDEIDTIGEYNNMVIKFRGYGDSNCELERSDITDSNEDWKITGEKLYEFKIIKNPIGTGTCTYTDDLGNSYNDVTVEEIQNGSFQRTLDTKVDCEIQEPPNIVECSDSNNGVKTKTWDVKYMPMNNGVSCVTKYPDISSANFDQNKKQYKDTSTCDRVCKGTETCTETKDGTCTKTGAGPGPGTQKWNVECTYDITQTKWNNGAPCPYADDAITQSYTKTTSCY
jgi:hypothetical protein